MENIIVVVDDEEEIADLVSTFLKNEGLVVKTFYNGNDAFSYISNHEVTLALLDVMLPDIDGFQLLQKIREKHFFPVLMLTAKGEDMDKITGLSLGADDYITKPFNPLEVTARVKTLLRRIQRYTPLGNTVEETEEYSKDGLIIQKNTHKVYLYEEEISVTPIEFKLLQYLFEKQGNVVSAEELFEKVWQEKYLDNNNTVMAHIARLREKLKEKPRSPKFIKTIWGVGYIIEK